MTTTTSATTTSTSSVVSSAAQSLLTSLGSGSGVDTTSLVASLVQAQFATQTDALTTKASALTTQISDVASLKSAVTGFTSALASLVKGGTLTTQPVSSNTSVLTATALSGAKLAGLSSTIKVGQLAAAQTARTTTAIADRTAQIGSGSLTLSFGTATYATADDGTTSMSGFTQKGSSIQIDIADGSSSLDNIASAINAKNAGLTASVVTDADGSAYLSLKSATGAAQAFTLTASDPSSGLAQFDVGVGATGTTLTGTAQNAKLTVDGVPVERTSNTISDLVNGVKLQLAGVSTSAVSLTSSTPTDALSEAVTNVVDTYNQVFATIKDQTDPITGPLRADPAAQALLRQMKAMTTQTLIPGAASGTPATLAAIGVTTNRDGTLAVDSTTLTRALATSPASIEAMFAYSSDNTSGLLSQLNAWSTTATDNTYGLGASTASYTAQQTKVSDAQTQITTDSANATTRLTQQFASMNSQVSAYKSIQSFLTNQIAAWNKSSN